MTSGAEVKFSGVQRDTTVYYGGPPPESGEWKVDLVYMEKYLSKCLEKINLGASIDIFILGFEIADIDGWGDSFSSMETYISYRPKMKAIISVGQLDWCKVKDLDAIEQYNLFKNLFNRAINRVGNMRRKPKDFDYVSLAILVNQAFDICPYKTQLQGEVHA